MERTIKYNKKLREETGVAIAVYYKRRKKPKNKMVWSYNAVRKYTKIV